MPTGPEIREKFLRYFESKEHRRVHSSSLVPANDPTLLFTNAGMNQFKDLFLGLDKPKHPRATTSQKCVRAGGKHNDLENVGFTKRHHTFFEMLGNFSFGDYFKKEAIEYAWELVTYESWFGVSKDKLYVTIFEGSGPNPLIPRDDEAEKCWLKVGVPKNRIFESGLKDNFWAMGDIGPCGPCSEIYYDMGVEASEKTYPDCAAGECQFPCPYDCGRYVEIWNLVFMQYNRYCEKERSGSWDKGEQAIHNHSNECLKLDLLPKPSVDTGMGLERLAAVLQGKLSNYDTDLFTPLLETAAMLTGVDLTKELDAEKSSHSAASLRVIADHARATTFLISDGVLPANEGRGYVLRKIMRRAFLHGRLLGEKKPFFHHMVPEVVKVMTQPSHSVPYPELLDSAERIQRLVYEEERRFLNTLDFGLSRLENDLNILKAEKKLAENPDATLAQLKEWFGKDITDKDFGYKPSHDPIYPGEKAFKLYDTFGLPLDLITDACRDAGIRFDAEGFERAMEEQRERARASWKGAAKTVAPAFLIDSPKTEFEGYRTTRSNNCKILYAISNRISKPGLAAGEEGEIILDRTCFYAESGGQTGDVGVLLGRDHQTVIAEVTGCYFPIHGVRAHKVKAKLPLIPGNSVDALVDAEVRQSTMRNHTATHLLHAALRETLGKHVKQAGSLVDPVHLRFDFSHFTGVADEELQDIEDIVNKEVLNNIKVETIENVPIDVAVNEYKAMALFGEKYGDKVRVVKIGDFSTELCGGTHTAATGEIGLIKILNEGSVSSGVRRVEAVTGEGSLRHFRLDHQLESVVASMIPGGKSATPAEALRAELEKKDAEIRKLHKELEQMRMKSASSAVASVDDKIREVKGVKVLVHRVDNLEREQIRTLVDNLRNKLGSGVVVFGSVQDGKVALTVGVTKDLTSKLQAGKIIKPIAEKVGGSGGGRPDMAEAGGKDPGQLDVALSGAYAAIEAML